MVANVHLDLLERVRIASPCPMRWEDLDGDGATRHCRRCDLDVHNFSMMSRGEVEGILAAKRGRLCGGFYRRADGTILTRDCPVGLRALRAKVRRAAARVAAAIGLLVAGGAAARQGDERVPLRTRQPFAALSSWLAPPPAPPMGSMILGDIAMPSPAPPATGNGAPVDGAGES
jgi:hypothetical protein